MLTCRWLRSIPIIGSTHLESSGADVCRDIGQLSAGDVTSCRFTTQHTEVDAPVGNVIAKIHRQIVGCAECSQPQHCYVLRTIVITAVVSTQQLRQKDSK